VAQSSAQQTRSVVVSNAASAPRPKLNRRPDFLNKAAARALPEEDRPARKKKSRPSQRSNKQKAAWQWDGSFMLMLTVSVIALNLFLSFWFSEPRSPMNSAPVSIAKSTPPTISKSQQPTSLFMSERARTPAELRWQPSASDWNIVD